MTTSSGGYQFCSYCNIALNREETDHIEKCSKMYKKGLVMFRYAGGRNSKRINQYCPLLGKDHYIRSGKSGEDYIYFYCEPWLKYIYEEVLEEADDIFCASIPKLRTLLNKYKVSVDTILASVALGGIASIQLMLEERIKEE